MEKQEFTEGQTHEAMIRLRGAGLTSKGLQKLIESREKAESVVALLEEKDIAKDKIEEKKIKKRKKTKKKTEKGCTVFFCKLCKSYQTYPDGCLECGYKEIEKKIIKPDEYCELISHSHREVKIIAKPGFLKRVFKILIDAPVYETALVKCIRCGKEEIIKNEVSGDDGCDM